VSEENVQIIRRAWEAYLRGDMDALVSLWDPEVVWDLQHFRNWPESGYHGVDGVRQFLTEWLELWGTMRSTSTSSFPLPTDAS
jgi:ketosteroid isomerase-like protein